jgi:hypothetical protein
MALVAGCGGPSDPTTLRVGDAAVGPGATPSVTTVTMTLTASRDDRLTGVAVLEPAEARARLIVLGGVAGGDGHLGHLDPKGSAPHSRTRALVLAGGRPVRLTTNGTRIELSGPVGVGPVRLRLFLASGAGATVTVAPRPLP